MWDYDKLFAEGNIVGIKNCYRDKIFNSVIDESKGTDLFCGYKNDLLSFKNQRVDIDYEIKCGYTTDFEIQYIIHLDEHGNVVEKLFDREADMPKPMPELETGMFVLVDTWGGAKLDFVDAEHNHVVYQESGYDYIDDDDINGRGIASEIIAVYDKDTRAFDFCTKDNLIWSKLKSN